MMLKVKFDKNLPTVSSGGRMVKARKRILLVDDDEDVRGCFRTMLVSHGYAVVEACDGMQGLKAFEIDGPFCAVLTDHTMPLMTGAQLAEAILKINPSQTIAVASGEFSKECLIPSGVSFLKKGYIAWERLAAALKLKVE
jgi:CheY-like chemotaxis protein